MKRIVLITGGNKGLGFDTAKVLQQKGYNVYIGSRDAERGRQAADELGVKYVQLDVTDDISIQQAYLQIQDREGRLDILINNAGISGGFKKPADLTVNDVQQVYNTNVFGIVRMMHTFIPLLEKSEQPVVVNVSSGLGSFGMVTNPNTQESKVNSLAYCSSKSAVTMITLQYAGSTNTDLVGDFSNNAKPASEGIIPIVKLATIDKDGPTGTFIDSNGSMPW